MTRYFLPLNHKRANLSQIFSAYICLIVTFLVIANQAHAMTVIKRNFSELVQHAEIIFMGTVVDSYSAWDSDNQSIDTYVTFSNLRVIKGDVDLNDITLRFLGGTVEDNSLYIPGMPEFKVGQRDIVFSRGNFIDVCPIVGIWQGRFKVEWDKTLGEEVVLDNYNSPIVGVKNNEVIKSSLSLRELEDKSKLSAEEFIRLIRNEMD